MKKGNQFYLEIKILDNEDNDLDINTIKKVQFNIEDLTKTTEDNEVTYDSENKVFKVWLTEEETFKFPSQTRIDCRILFKNGTIMGSNIIKKYFYESLKEVLLDDESEINE